MGKDSLIEEIRKSKWAHPITPEDIAVNATIERCVNIIRQHQVEQSRDRDNG